MAPKTRLRTTRSTQPIEAPTQHASIGEGPSLEGATNNGDLGDFSNGDLGVFSLAMILSSHSTRLGRLTPTVCVTNGCIFFNNSKYILQTLTLYFSST